MRVFNLIKTLHDLVEANALEQPFLIPIGERATKIAEAFGERQVHTQTALDEFTTLTREAQEGTERYGQSGLSREGFAAYWFLRGRGIDGAEAIGRRMDEAFAGFPHWRTDGKQEQQVRLELYKALFGGGVKTRCRAHRGRDPDHPAAGERMRHAHLSPAEPLPEPIGVDEFKAEVRAWAERIGVQPVEIHVRPMRRKWASCSSRGRLTFDVELLSQPGEIRDEVVVHELVHLKVPNHGGLFRTFVRAHQAEDTP